MLQKGGINHLKIDSYINEFRYLIIVRPVSAFLHHACGLILKNSTGANGEQNLLTNIALKL